MSNPHRKICGQLALALRQPDSPSESRRASPVENLPAPLLRQLADASGFTEHSNILQNVRMLFFLVKIIPNLDFCLINQ